MSLMSFGAVPAPPSAHELAQLAPSQQHIDAEQALPTGPAAPPDQAEYAAKPHLRAVVIVASAGFFFLVRHLGHQVAALPVMMFLVSATSTLWCTPRELVLALGPVPTCLFQRRIPYSEIVSIVVVRGRFQTLAALMSQGARLWQPHGWAYGLTLGKDLVDVRLKSGKIKGFWPSRILVSVDDPDDVVALMNFRRQSGPDVPLPGVRHSPHPIDSVSQRVLCDAFGTTQLVTCDACDVLLLPFQTAVASPPSDLGPPSILGKTS